VGPASGDFLVATHLTAKELAMSVTTSLPIRPGTRPTARTQTPHQQLDQIAPQQLQEELWQRMIGLAHVTAGPSEISMADTRALHLDRSVAHGPLEAFLPTAGTEFAHLHGPADGSLHVHLTVEIAQQAIDAGWAELHPIARSGLIPPVLVMVYGPRDQDGLEVVWRLVELSYQFALGNADEPSSPDHVERR
jgi:hypothetical protein